MHESNRANHVLGMSRYRGCAQKNQQDNAVGFGDWAVHLAGLASCSDELRQTKLDMELVTTAVLAGYL